MKTLLTAAALLAFVGAGLGGCATAPKTEGERQAVRSEGQAAIARMTEKYPTLQTALSQAYGYAIFPSVAKAAVGVGGAYGRGEVYEQGRFVGYSDLTQATVGLALGGQGYSEILLFQNKEAMDRFKFGKIKFAANASAVALKAGESVSARYAEGVAVFTEPKGGLMFEASIGGQDFGFQPASDPASGDTGSSGRAPNLTPPSAGTESVTALTSDGTTQPSAAPPATQPIP